MNEFLKIMNEVYPGRDVRVKVGGTEIFIGRNCGGLERLRADELKWLCNHSPIHKWWSAKEVELVYRKSKKFEEIVWN